MNEEIRNNEISEEQLEDVSGGSNGAPLMCQKCGTTKDVNTSYRLCPTCYKGLSPLENSLIRPGNTCPPLEHIWSNNPNEDAGI